MENNEETIVTKEKKKSKLWLAILINILTIALAAGGVYYYFEYIDKDEVKEVTETEETEIEEQKESLKITFSEIEDYVYRYDPSVIWDSENAVLYEKDITLPQNLEMKAINVSVVKDLGVIYTNESFSLEQYNNSLIKLYGKEFAETVEPADIYIAFELKEYTYDPTTKMFIYAVPTGYGGTGPASYFRKVNEVEYIDNQMIITMGIVDCDYIEYNPDTYTTEHYTCSKLDSDELISNDRDPSSTRIYSADYVPYEEMTHFNYTYDYDEELDNYYLVSISKK